MAKNLTKRQREIFNYIQRCIAEGYPPTIREIGSHFGFSEKAAHDHLNALEKKKYIEREDGKPRAISVLKEGQPKIVPSKLLEEQAPNSNVMALPRDIMEIPIFGRVAAGTPLLASQNIEGTFPIPTRMVNNYECFALRIIGSSMIGVGILEGDYVIVKRQSDADPGDIVVAMVEDEATVKRFFMDGDQVRLQPENPAIEPSIFDIGDVTILGKVIGLHREIY